MFMFPHTVTVYNVSAQTDPETYKDKVAIYITILRGVLLDETKAVNVNKSGLIGADAVNLYIPFGVDAVDGRTGKAKEYAGPHEFWQAGEDRAGIWTLSLEGEGDNDSKTQERTFFAKGEAVPPPEIPEGEIEAYIGLKYDSVYRVTKVDKKDFGGLAHWEVGGN